MTISCVGTLKNRPWEFSFFIFIFISGLPHCASSNDPREEHLSILVNFNSHSNNQRTVSSSNQKVILASISITVDNRLIAADNSIYISQCN